MTFRVARSRPSRSRAIAVVRSAKNRVRRALGLDTRFHVHALLKAHHVPLRYTPADLADDLDAHRALGILPDR